ncbi:MAG TPA: hypothetical protein VNO52_00565 [Methylomirabilota bacterium]|nr:hypothetical protein [Methylomirabilota bacterium]
MTAVLFQLLRAAAVAALVPLLLLQVSAAPAAPGYETGLASVRKICAELHASLPPARQRSVLAEPGLVEHPSPWITPAPATDGRGEIRLTTGFVDFMNALAHARALDTRQEQFSTRYVATLGSCENVPPVSSLPLPAEAWSFDTLNRQSSLFNQTVGALAAVCLAHHYLGHHRKHAAALRSTEGPVPFYTVATASEWREAVLKGAKNALDCGMGVEGLCSFYECLERAAPRPAWVAHFLPAKADLSRLRKDLEKLEKNFFLAGD